MNILLTSVGRRGYLVNYFKEELAGIGRVFAANSEYTAALALADGYVLTPLIFSGGYIDFLANYCKANDITAVISLFDVDLPVLAENREALAAQGIKVLIASVETIGICNDKYLTYQFLRDNGFHTPETFCSVEDCKAAIARGELDFPLIIKPRWGMGSIGLYTAENMAELEVLYRKVQREVFASYLKYESAQDRDHCVIIQRKLVGSEVGVDVINDLDGNFVAVSAKRKLAMRAGETDVALMIKDEGIERIGRKLSALLRHPASLATDCFMIGDDLYFLEMNCRFAGQYPFTHMAGINLVKQIVLWLTGHGTDMGLFNLKEGVLACKELRPMIFDFPVHEDCGGLLITKNRASAQELNGFFQAVSDDFHPALATRADLSALAVKLKTRGVVFEAWDGDKLIAALAGYANDFRTLTAFISVVAVSAGYRNRGVAQRMLERMIQYSRLLRMKKILVQTEADNFEAVKLYEKLGFQGSPAGERKKSFTLDL